MKDRIMKAIIVFIIMFFVILTYRYFTLPPAYEWPDLEEKEVWVPKEKEYLDKDYVFDCPEGIECKG